MAYENVVLSREAKKGFVERMKKAFVEDDIVGLKEISNEAIESVALVEDKDLVDISLIAYSLYKLISKPHYTEGRSWAMFVDDVLDDLDEVHALVRAGKDLHGILEEDIMRDIAIMDESYSNYLKDVLYKARIKQASRLYALGLSLNRAVALTGADKFKVAAYVGTTRIHDRPFTQTKSVKERLGYVREVLG
ncbi:MAG: hypothetical protein JW834_00855 [Candidatus Diapherotrites archaeon]|nr:hypothetical protein [Candidatus Diapherotrites archaeon]